MISRVISGMRTGASAGESSEPDEPHDGILQVHIQRADIDRPHIRMVRRRGVTGLNHDRADQGGGEFQAETEVGPLPGCFQDLTDAGQLDGGDQVMGGVVPVAAVAQQNLLAPLRNHAKGWLDHAVNRLQRQGGAGQVKPFQRLGVSIFGNSAHDPLNQFLAIGLHPLCLAFCLLVG